MSAFQAFLRSLAAEDLYGDLDYYCDKSDTLQTALGKAADHINELELTIAKKEQRITDLEALFEPFLRNFLKQNE